MLGCTFPLIPIESTKVADFMEQLEVTCSRSRLGPLLQFEPDGFEGNAIDSIGIDETVIEG
jgi:hypothetical protein